ncbi:MAG: S9 family peptidase, partial [Planctomycetes bacterium]|nr:S9 family peptidase [Planctomycetota bacterium]
MPSRVALSFVSLLVLGGVACSSAPTSTSTAIAPSGTALVAPRAAIHPESLTMHGDVRVDDYYWLRERENPEVIAYLEAENQYAAAALEPMRPIQESIYQELVSRVAENDTSVPYREGEWVYYERELEGKEYPLLCRRPAASVTDIARAAENVTDEQVMVDVNALAEGHEFFSLSGAEVSPDGRLIALACDTVGRRFATITVKDLSSGAMLEDRIPDVSANLEWANDNRTLFYVRKDPETLREYQVYRHELGEDPSEDVLVFEETDTTFELSIGRTTSDRFIVIESEQTLSSEVRVIDANDPWSTPRVVAPRLDHLYSLDHLGESFYIRTNWDAVNFRLMRAPESSTSRDDWVELVPHRSDVLLGSFTLFDEHLVLSERRNGLRTLRIIPWNDFDAAYEIPFADPVYVAFATRNREPDDPWFRYIYSSPVTPTSTYEIHLKTHEQRLLKRREVGGGYDPSQYVAERIWAPARDGTRIPVSLVHHKAFAKDGSAPLLLEGYGSYGAPSDPWFNSSEVSLLDRGFVCATAHVRGGSEMGRQWYEDGKLLKKMNTFTDFIDVAHHLVRLGYASADDLYASGGSAGGLLMGAVINLEPELFRGVAAAVPFVDVVTTMLDESIPLTTFEYDEWGNPNEREYYDYMMSYSPYDNVAAQDYPPMLVLTGLHDSQVQY